MGILVNTDTKVVVQGITGREGSFHTAQMLAYGTKVVAGVTPGKEGESVHDVPVFNTVKAAITNTGANASIIFVPPRFAKGAVVEAIEAGIELIVLITEGIPMKDSIEISALVEKAQVRLIGPNCPGLVTIGESKLGIMPGSIFSKGDIGLVARSGTLTYEVIFALTRNGLGQSSCVGIGGDPMPGTRFIDVLPLFAKDPETTAVVLIGEIGGTDEETAAEYIKTMTKPVVAFVSGKSAPEGKRMGHAGAIISGDKGTYASKFKAFTESGVPVAQEHEEIPLILRKLLNR